MGISFFVSLGTDTRSSALGTFNSASSAWDGTGFAAFRASAGNFTLGATAAQTVFLSAQSTPDTYPDREGATVPAKTLFFSGVGTPLAPFSSWTPLTTQGAANPQTPSLVRNGAGGASSPVPVSPLYSSSSSMKCKSSSSSSTSSDCSPSCSTYVSPASGTTRTCYTFFVLSKVCLVVDPATGSSSGAGCIANPDSRVPASVNMKDASTQLAQFDFTSVGGTGTPSPSQGYTNIPITVRASTDPYVVMLRLTQGGMNFGLTTAQKITSGIAFTVAGLLFTCCVYGGLYYFVTSCQHRKPGYVVSGVQPQQLVILSGEQPPQPYKPMQPMYPQMPMGQQQQMGYPPPQQHYPAAAYPPPMQQQPYPAYPPMQQPMPQAYGQQQYPQAGYGGYPPQQQQGSNV